MDTNGNTFGLKDIIRGVRETFPFAIFKFHYTPDSPDPMATIAIGNDGPKGTHGLVIQRTDEGFLLSLDVIAWGDGSEPSHWDTLDKLPLDLEGSPGDDLVGWLSCVRADIPEDKDKPMWEEEEIHQLPNTARMCWSESPTTERFPVVRVHGTLYKTSNSQWKILFIRPGESAAFILNNQEQAMRHLPEALLREIEHAAGTLC